MFAGGEPVYTGAFWSSLSSINFKGVTIDISDLKDDFRVLKLALGYPALDAKHIAIDPRPNRRIFRALEKYGVLREQVWMYGKCKQIRSTGKRRNSYVFTFDVISVVKSTYDRPEVVFEIFDDTGKSLRSAVEADWESKTQLGEKWRFNAQKEILLKFERSVGDKVDNVYLDDFEEKD